MTRLLRRHYGDGGYAIVDAAAGSSPASRALESYFAGATTALDGVHVATSGSDFQRRVWRELRAIPAGTTISYAELARRIGQPSAVRAVGLANGQNPVGIVVPCHRVIGSDGSLTGYGGGIARKRWLLTHEGALSAVREGALFEASPPRGPSEIARPR
ncbi:methylated-DNA--[protein]-cysteine S-methyltransferase [Candidatus Binatia bacterium]|nr:methylated-DNA--[protein]-cysteine S-methyltransferase [Candidatus Binatia bacterium]